MLHRRVAIHLISLLGLFFQGTLNAQDGSQKMPREDVIDSPAIAEGLCVSNVFQANMVLQRDKPVAIWGWAETGENVIVTMNGAEQAAIANNDRLWQVTLPAMPANSAPQTLTILGTNKTLTLKQIQALRQQDVERSLRNAEVLKSTEHP